jgi:hypothetical protein
MGQNFYKVVRIEKVFSFSISSAREVYDWLNEQGYLDALNNQGSGFVDVPVSSLEKMLEEISITDVKVLKGIQEDVEQANLAKIQFLTYEVF